MIRKLRRSLEAAVKRDRILKMAFCRARGLHHRARMRIFGSLWDGPAVRSAALRSGVNPENVLWIFSTARSGNNLAQGHARGPPRGKRGLGGA